MIIATVGTTAIIRTSQNIWCFRSQGEIYTDWNASMRPNLIFGNVKTEYEGRAIQYV